MNYPNGLLTILEAHKNGTTLTLSFGFAFFSAKQMANQLEDQGWSVHLRRQDPNQTQEEGYQAFRPGSPVRKTYAEAFQDVFNTGCLQ